MEKIKLFIQSQKGKDILTIIIVILVGLGSFGLGRLSKQSTSEGIKIEYPNGPVSLVANVVSAVSNPQSSAQSTSSSSKSFFASNKGSKYYSLGCPGGKSIKQENRIYFSTRTAAESAGYTLSSSCK